MIALEEIRRLAPGMVIDFTMIDEDHPLAFKAKFPGKTLRMVYTSSNVLLLPAEHHLVAGGRMLSPVTRMIYGRAVLTNVPEHIFVPVDDPVHAEFHGHMYGIHAWLTERLEVIGVA